MKIITVIGARPQFIKAAAVSTAFAKRAQIEELILHTGQHFDSNMSDIFFEELSIPKPHFNLGIGGGNHGAMTGAQLAGIEEILLHERPDWVLVYGDTNSTLAGALAAVKLHIKVAHVEAGLRSYNRKMPEEINRIATDHISDLLFAPTQMAMENLRGEGIAPSNYFYSGDVMQDAAMYFGNISDQKSDILAKNSLTKGQFILSTIHRAENTDRPSNLMTILEGLAKASDTLPIVLPLHPRTRKIIDSLNIDQSMLSKLMFIDPVGYLDMVSLEKNAALIATDSGGVQKEAFFHRIPCVTLRNETEWVELVESGWNRLCPPTSAIDISNSISNAIGTQGVEISPYGTGNASEIIAKCLLES